MPVSLVPTCQGVETRWENTFLIDILKIITVENVKNCSTTLTESILLINYYFLKFWDFILIPLHPAYDTPMSDVSCILLTETNQFFSMIFTNLCLSEWSCIKFLITVDHHISQLRTCWNILIIYCFGTKFEFNCVILHKILN